MDQVGRVYCWPKDPPLRINCASCAFYRKAIKDYLADYVSRSIQQEGMALKKLKDSLEEI